MKSVLVIGNTQLEAQQWLDQAGIPEPNIALGVGQLRAVEGLRVAQVLVLNTVRGLTIDQIHQLRRQLAISIGGAYPLSQTSTGYIPKTKNARPRKA